MKVLILIFTLTSLTHCNGRITMQARFKRLAVDDGEGGTLDIVNNHAEPIHAEVKPAADEKAQVAEDGDTGAGAEAGADAGADAGGDAGAALVTEASADKGAAADTGAVAASDTGAVAGTETRENEGAAAATSASSGSGAVAGTETRENEGAAAATSASSGSGAVAGTETRENEGAAAATSASSGSGADAVPGADVAPSAVSDAGTVPSSVPGAVPEAVQGAGTEGTQKISKKSNNTYNSNILYVIRQVSHIIAFVVLMTQVVLEYLPFVSNLYHIFNGFITVMKAI